jgi:hypothetical protein
LVWETFKSFLPGGATEAPQRPGMTAEQDRRVGRTRGSRKARSGEPTLEQRRQKTGGLLKQAADMRAKRARQQYEEGRAATEAGIAGALGRSARMARGGGTTTAMAGIGRDLARQSATAEADAELARVEGLLDREQFMADSQVSDAEALEQVKQYAESVQATYESFLDDDEKGFADDIEGWAKGKSPAVVAAAKNYADDVRSGRIKMGWA